MRRFWDKLDSDARFTLGLWVWIAFLTLIAFALKASALEVFPLPQDSCGAWGNTVAAAQQRRNDGMDLHQAMLELLEAEKACEEKWGQKAADQCLLPSEVTKTWALERFKDIWHADPKDPMTAGFDAYTGCLAANGGKEM